MGLDTVCASGTYLSYNEVHFGAKVIEDAGLLTPDVARPYDHKPTTAPRLQPHVKIASGPCITCLCRDFSKTHA